MYKKTLKNNMAVSENGPLPPKGNSNKEKTMIFTLIDTYMTYWQWLSHDEPMGFRSFPNIFSQQPYIDTDSPHFFKGLQPDKADQSLLNMDESIITSSNIAIAMQ